MSNSSSHHNPQRQDKPASGIHFTKEPRPLTFGEVVEGVAHLATLGVVGTTDIVEAMHREILLRPIGRFNDIHKRKWQYGITGQIYGAVRGITNLLGRHVVTPIQIYNEFFAPHTTPPLPNTLKLLVNVVNGVMGDHLATKGNTLAVPMMFYDRYEQPLLIQSSDQPPDQSPSVSQLVKTTKLKQTSRLISQASGQSVDKLSRKVFNEETPKQGHNHDKNDDGGRHKRGSRRQISGRVVVFVHGLCMSYLCWRPCDAQGLGERVVYDDPTATILYLDYNTGRRISVNGRNLSQMLERLVINHPDITQIDLVGHSMGGLVARSALYYGEKQASLWVTRTCHLVTLGSPHHGAVLERIGNYVQEVVSRIPFAGSLSKLGDIRSVGIIDLRHGSIRECDWHAFADRRSTSDDSRHLVQPPAHINTYFVAGTLVEGLHSSKVSYLLGDGLVTIDSALGQHETDQKSDQNIMIPENHKAIFYGVSHYDMLYHPKIHQQVIAWLHSSDHEQNQSHSKIYVYPEELEVVI